MNRHQMQRALHELAAQAVLPDLDLWPAVRARVAQRSHRTLWTRMLPATRLGWASLTLVALFVFGVTAYATAPAIGRLLRMDDQLKDAADPASLGQSFNLSQTIDNVTITMQWAYADADHVWIGYTIRSSDENRFDPYREMLADTTGAVFQWQRSYGVSGQSDILQVTLPPGEFSSLAIFVKSPTVSQTLDLRFTVHVQELIIPTTPVTPSLDSGSVIAQPAPMGTVIGPFTFDFSIPVGQPR
jgi:hypothetical protein